MLASYHGIIRINKYADFILRSIYTLYTYDNKLNLVVPIEKREDIDPTVLAQFMLNTTEIIKSINNEIKISCKVDLNSLGDFLYGINDAVNFLGSNELMYSLGTIVIALCTGKYGPEVLKSILNFITEWRKTNI